MEKKATRFFAVLLALTLCVSLVAPVFAAGTTVLTDVTASDPTTLAGEAKIRVSLSGVSGDVSTAQVALSFTGDMSYKSVAFLGGRDDPANGYTLAVTPRSAVNGDKRLTVGLLAVRTPLRFTGDDALFVVTFTGDPGQTVSVTVDEENSFYKIGSGVDGEQTPLPAASLTATASAVSNTAKSAAVKIMMDKVTDFSDTDLAFVTLTVTDEGDGSVTTAALDRSYRDGTVSTPTYNMPISVLEGHSYRVELSGAGFVSYRKTGETFDADLTIDNADFVPGDVNGDGRVNDADRAAFDALKSGSAYSYTIAADFNRDGAVNAHDAAYLHASSGTPTGGGAGGGGAGGGGGGGGGAAAPTQSYQVSVPAATAEGSVSVSGASANAGDWVSLTPKPAAGYRVGTLTVRDADGNSLSLSTVGGAYQFIMPAANVSVAATFVREAQSAAFDDVSAGSFYHDAVVWAVEKGVTGGVGNNLFAPDAACTRSQAVTFLWRASGSPEPTGAQSFSDVPSDSFYEKAVLWAVEKGVTAGVGGGLFNPDGVCTRGQIVTFLYRLAGQPTVSGSVSFADVKADDFFRDAVAWASAKGVTAGTGFGLFSPEQTCTRGQIVTFLFRDLTDEA